MSPVYQCSSPYDRTQNIVSYQLGSRPTNRTRHHRTTYYTSGLLYQFEHMVTSVIAHLPTEDIDNRLIWFISNLHRLTQPSVSVCSVQITNQSKQSSRLGFRGVLQLSPLILSPFTMLISSFSEICSAGTALKGCVRKYNFSVRILKFTVAVFQCTGTVIRAALDPYIFTLYCLNFRHEPVQNLRFQSLRRG